MPIFLSDIHINAKSNDNFNFFYLLNNKYDLSRKNYNKVLGISIQSIILNNMFLIDLDFMAESSCVLYVKLKVLKFNFL